MVRKLKQFFLDNPPRKLWFKIVFRLPLRKCSCGEKPYLRNKLMYVRKDIFGVQTIDRWSVECDRNTCPRMMTRVYDKPLKAIFMWNFRNYKLIF